jgi:hypothetical protein
MVADKRETMLNELATECRRVDKSWMRIKQQIV